MRRVLRSPTVRTAMVMGAAGVGFAGANVILARVLPTAQYALFTLMVALVNVSHPLAPAGMDGIVNRRRLEVGPDLLRTTLITCSLVALGFGILGSLVYDLGPVLLLLLFVSTTAGGAMMVAAAQFQSERRFAISLALLQSSNIVLLVAGLAVVLSGVWEARLPLIIYTFGFVCAAAYGWWRLFRERAGKPFTETSFPWSEALSYAGLSAAGLLLIQLERLVIPHVLTEHDLATFGVLAAIAGSLFRVLQMGVGYTLMPRLRAAPDIIHRRQLIAHEAKLVGAIILAGSAVIWFVTPLLERWFLAGKYHLGGALLIAALVSGVAKVLSAFTKTTAMALITPGELSMLNLLGWASSALAVAAAVIGGRWGLAGVIYGVALGWLARATAAFCFTIRHLRLPSAIPATAP